MISREDFLINYGIHYTSAEKEFNRTLEKQNKSFGF